MDGAVVRDHIAGHEVWLRVRRHWCYNQDRSAARVASYSCLFSLGPAHQPERGELLRDDHGRPIWRPSLQALRDAAFCFLHERLTAQTPTGQGAAQRGQPIGTGGRVARILSPGGEQTAKGRGPFRQTV